MDINLPNAAPQHLALGIYDGSGRVVEIAPELLPTHLAKFYIYAEKGDVEPKNATGAGLEELFGARTFRADSPYYNHATDLLKIINATGNLVRVQRVIPEDAGPRSTLRFSLDVLPTRVPLYLRNEDGSIQRNDMGEPKVDGNKTTPGFKCMWVAAPIAADQQGNVPFGSGAISDGFQVDAAGAQSKLYPMFDFEVHHQGSYGNNQGVRLYAPVETDPAPVDMGLLANEKAYPFRIQMIRRDDEDSVGKVFTTPGGSQYLDVVVKPNTKDRRYNNNISIGDAVIPAYEMRDVPGMNDREGLFKRLHVYQANIDSLLKQFYDAEKPFIDQFSDFTGEEKEEYRFNFIGGFTSRGVPYHSFHLIDSLPEAQSMNRNSVAYAGGGSDGTMSNALFAKLVGAELRKYADPYEDVQDDARHVESIFYDSGFPLETKYDALSVIALRKDTFVALTTFDVDGVPLTVEQELSLAMSLKTMARFYPESTIFGTSTCRALVSGFSGRFSGGDSQLGTRVPLLFEFAKKAAEFMGPASGRWNSQARFDHSPGSIIQNMTDLSVKYMPVPVRYRAWENGLVWAQSYDTSRFYFPQSQTVYDDDTSILNSFVTAMVCVDLQKIGARLTRYYQGALLTNEQLIQRTERRFRDWTKDKYDDMYRIEPQTVIEGLDKQRGFIWFTRCKLWGPNQKTVGIFAVEAYRLDDLNAQN